MTALLRKALREQRRSALGWGVGSLGLALLYAAIFPSIVESQSALDSYMRSLPEAFRELFGTDYSSPAGYLRAEFFSALGVLVFLLLSIGAGARAIGGEEEAGTLELLLAFPVRRRAVLLTKLAALAASSVAVAFVLWAGLAIVGPVFDLDVPLGDLAAGIVMLWLLGLAFGAIALAVGAATGRRSTALVVTSVLAAASYLVNLFGPVVDALGPGRPLSLFRWYLDPDPLTTGLHAASVLVLLAVAAGATVLGLLAFERRDVG
ncbi:MAG: ABC transporter permease subunit [Actinomycetota bacterium]